MNINPLFSVRVKINRAKHHTADLEAAISQYLGSNPYEIVADVDTQTEQVSYCFRYLQPIPCDWGGMIGETIHALRSSLDNLATALAILNGTTSNVTLKNTYFPIGATKDVFDKRLARDLKGTSRVARRLVERMKPYKGGTDAFWQLHQLDILDKHTSLIPVGAGAGRVGIKFPPPLPGQTHPSATLPVVYFGLRNCFPLKDGDEMFAMQMTAAAYKASPDAPQIDTTEEARKQKTDFQVTFHVAFGEGQIIDGEPVIPALKQFIDFTERVIDIFARKIFRADW